MLYLILLFLKYMMLRLFKFIALLAHNYCSLKIVYKKQAKRILVFIDSAKFVPIVKLVLLL